MKRVIFCLLVICFFTLPCYAQVETERFLTPEGTEWQIDNPEGANVSLGFFEGFIYLCNETGCFLQFASGASHYKNRLISKYSGHLCQSPVPLPGPLICFTVSGYTISLFKFGKVKFCEAVVGQTEQCFESTLTKISNDFIPSD